MCRRNLKHQHCEEWERDSGSDTTAKEAYATRHRLSH